MSKKKVIIVCVAVAVIVAAVVFVIVRRRKQKLSEGTADGSSGSATSDSGNGGNYRRVDTADKPSFPIKRGDRGEVVKSIQKALNTVQKSGLVVDGIFGSNTEAALVAYNGKKQLDWEEWIVLMAQAGNVGENFKNSI